MDSKKNSKIEDEDIQKDFDDLFKYLKSVLHINKSLSSVFMGITLTAFIFLISLGYPDILEETLIIGGNPIKVVALSLSILVLSFFFFLTSTIIYNYCELNLLSLYLYWDPEFSLSNRYKRSEKLYNRYYHIANAILLYGVISLIAAVIFIFLYFSAIGIFLAIVILIISGIILGMAYLFLRIKRYIKNKKKLKIKPIDNKL